QLDALDEAQVGERVLHPGQDRDVVAPRDLTYVDVGKHQTCDQADAERRHALDPAPEPLHPASLHGAPASTDVKKRIQCAPRMTEKVEKPLTYRDAGVDIDEGDALVERIKPHARRTVRPEVLAGIGGFGGLFEIPRGYTEPGPVAGTDGGGTQLKSAFESGRHARVGVGPLAMS